MKQFKMASITIHRLNSELVEYYLIFIPINEIQKVWLSIAIPFLVLTLL
jgi:hypothetical protein